ncbi:hypothetical protein FRC08_014182 [Ceratobasidium sp. 394]|nr:hypothetical protein FRC08_014182 [Ceratobasidium sp. 394]
MPISQLYTLVNARKQMSTVVFEGTGTKLPQSHAPPHASATSRATPRKNPTVDSALTLLENGENDEEFVLDFDSESVLGLGDDFVITGGKHPRFWLDDGNVVLVASQPSQTQFRVHQSVLGKQFPPSPPIPYQYTHAPG